MINWLRNIWMNEFEIKFRNANINGEKLLALNEGNICSTLGIEEAHGQSMLTYIKVLHGQKVKADASQSKKKKKKGSKAATLDDFDMIKAIGKGAFGDVWMAKHDKSGENYAIKILDKAHIAQTDTLQNVLMEKRILKLIHEKEICPFIVELRFAFQDENKLYLVLSLVTGGDLYSNLDKMPNKCFPVDVVRLYAAEILLALQWMHQKRVAYRDLKAENVLIGSDGHIVVTDMGLAKQWNPDEEMHSDSIVGTPEYMPPEVIREEGHSLTMDFWSLGVLAYELMVGQTPFSSDDAKGLFVNILMHAPAFPDYIPVDAQDWIMQLLNKDPTERLGAGPNGAEKIRQHKYFSCFDWTDLRNKRVEPAWKPKDHTAVGWSVYKKKDDKPQKEEADFDDFEEDLTTTGTEEDAEAVAAEQLKLENIQAEMEKEQARIAQLEGKKETLAEEVGKLNLSLEEREKQLDLIINLVPHMICVKDSNGLYLLANEPMAKAYSMTPQQLVGKRQMDLANDKQEAADMIEADRKVIQSGRRLVTELCLKNELGGSSNRPRTIRVTKIPYSDGGRDCVLAIGEDISEFVDRANQGQSDIETLRLDAGRLQKKVELLEQQLAFYKYVAKNPEAAQK